MTTVYYQKNFTQTKANALKLLADIFTPHSSLVIKIHFGEPGNNTAFQPPDLQPIIEALKLLDIQVTLLDTPVAYDSPRHSVKGYQQVIKQKGWDQLAPCVISNHYQSVKTKDFTAQVCQELIEAKQVLVISHLKGHSCAGFGGAIKNLGMGGVSPQTKAIEHDLSKPYFVSDCMGCGTCARLCPAQAIKMRNGQAEFDLNRCYGCSICQLNCPFLCLQPKQALFDDLLAQGAVAVLKKLPQKTYFINYLFRLTQKCDCEDDPGQILAPDLGILWADQAIAIDQASLDLIKPANQQDIFEAANHKDPSLQLKFASQYLKKSSKYQLLNL